MPFRLAALAYPMVALGLLASRTSAVAEFERAGAFDESTARRPESLEVRRKLVQKAVAKKLLVAVGDGRFYVDRAATKRRDRNALVLAGCAGAVITAAIVLLM